MGAPPYLPPFVGPAGLSIPSYQSILQDLVNKFLAIYGANEYVGIDSPIYQLLSVIALKISDVMQQGQYVYNQSSPHTAIGAGLDRIVKLNGIARLPFTFSVVTLQITGTIGTVITNGEAQDSNGNIWILQSPTTLTTSPQNVTATCQTPGNITAEPGTITIIATPQAGWASVTNGAAAIPGTPVETDSQLRARQTIAVALPSITVFAGTVAALQALEGVDLVSALENPTDSVDSFGNPPHSITCIIEGSASLASIAQTIYNNKSIGCETNNEVNGATIPQSQTVNVTDPATGWVIPINFISPPQQVLIYVTLNVHLLNGGSSATLAAIQAAVVAYLNNLEIGEIVTVSALYAAAMAVTPNLAVPIFSIHALFVGTTPSPSGTSDIAIAFYQVSQGTNVSVVVNSV